MQRGHHRHPHLYHCSHVLLWPFFFYEARYMSGRASVVNNSIDPNNSYITYDPRKAQATGDEQMKSNGSCIKPTRPGGIGISGVPQ